MEEVTKKQLLPKVYVKNGSFTGEKNLYRLAWLTVLCFDLTVVNWYPGFLPLELTSKLRNVRVIFPFLLAFLLNLSLFLRPALALYLSQHDVLGWEDLSTRSRFLSLIERKKDACSFCTSLQYLFLFNQLTHVEEDTPVQLSIHSQD